MNYSKLVINLTALFFVVYGLLFTILPSELAELVTGSIPATASGLTDMRATYGGLSIAVGVLMLVLAKNEGTHRLGLTFVALTMLGMASSRTLGFVVDGPQNSVMVAYLVAELFAASWAIILLRRKR